MRLSIRKMRLAKNAVENRKSSAVSVLCTSLQNCVSFPSRKRLSKALYQARRMIGGGVMMRQIFKLWWKAWADYAQRMFTDKKCHSHSHTAYHTATAACLGNGCIRKTTRARSCISMVFITAFTWYIIYRFINFSVFLFLFTWTLLFDWLLARLIEACTLTRRYNLTPYNSFCLHISPPHICTSSTYEWTLFSRLTIRLFACIADTTFLP